MAIDLINRVVKISVCDDDHIDVIKELCTEKVETERLMVVGPNGNVVDIAPSTVTQKLRKFLELEGCKITEKVESGYHGKKELIGKSVNVRPYYQNNYNNGVLISVPISGTEGNIQKKADYIHELFMTFFGKHQIPTARVCMETILGCDMKYIDVKKGKKSKKPKQ